MLKIFVKIVQFIIGFILGILLFSGASLAGAYLVYTWFANVPPKPFYPDDKTAPPAVVIKKDPAPAVASSPQPASSPVTPSPQTTPSISPDLTTTKSDPPPVVPSAQTTPETGTFNARVIRGLNIRSEPSAQSKRLGGLYYNDRIVVLQTSDDQKWQKIRVLSTGVEGWIKSGNIKKME